MNNEPFKYYTIKQRLFDVALFAIIVMILGYALPCALVGELIGF